MSNKTFTPTHVYTGPTTPHGLKNNTACRFYGKQKKAQGVAQIETKGAKYLLVSRSHVEVLS